MDKQDMDKRPYVLSIAGFDPSAGAGVLSDIKCFEQHQVYGFGICTALTVQTDASFISCEWMNASQIIAQLKPLMDKFDVRACKVALIKDSSVLLEVISYIKSNNQHTKIILDPVLKSSSGFSFHHWDLEGMTAVLTRLDLITPNYQEMQHMGNSENAEETARMWSAHCPVLLKGGHNSKAPGTDFLFCADKAVMAFAITWGEVYQKHGSGCVLSAAITANLALGFPLDEACRKAKHYTELFLKSNESLLGYHSLSPKINN
ncbi:hydroxymethylpyrimidine/phosphomethylpyrimidine kinase [Pedobacter psychroterrae]|nr:hydroxymethylpyrimidine/phosphomethylpyrimidine kinase [Pedobacter psychroterrae]